MRYLVDGERQVGLIVAVVVVATVKLMVATEVVGRIDRVSPADSEHSNSHLVALVDASVQLMLECTKM